VRLPEFRLGAVVAVGIAAGLGVWLGVRDTGGRSTPGTTTAAGPTGHEVLPVSAAELRTLAPAFGRPIYWAGTMAGYTYQMARLQNGDVELRYLPKGAKAGDPRPSLTIGTYRVANAIAATERAAGTSGARTFPISGHGIAFSAKRSPRSVYLAYPHSDYQVEVYDPRPGRALALVRSGKIVLVPVERPGARIVSLQQLVAAAHALHHPVYWAGPGHGKVYELTTTPTGRAYVRYLLPGTKAGADVPELTVATYPVANAYEVTIRAAAQPGSVTVPVTGNGIAFYAKSDPTSVYFARPRQSVQVEVYFPQASEAASLVTNGAVVEVP
jgi:hypothetical protein